MSSTTGAIFTGSSQFSTSLAAMVQKAVTAASHPIKRLTSQGNELSSQSDEISTLNSRFTALQSAVKQIDSAANFVLQRQRFRSDIHHRQSRRRSCRGPLLRHGDWMRGGVG